MTKEELQKEAYEWTEKNISIGISMYNPSIEMYCGKAYIEGAEPREKRIAELKEKLKTAYRKGMRHMAKALKDYDRTDGAWTDYFEHTVDKVLQREQLDFEEYGTLADQLTKAREIILRLYNAGRNVLMCRTEERAYDNLSNAINDKSIEQFLSEVEK